MTLIVALRGRDGLVLAGDSRGTIGDPRGLTAITDTQTKLFRLSRYCGIGTSGSAELAAKIVDDLTTKLGPDNYQCVGEIMPVMRTFIREQYQDWFGKFQIENRPLVMFTLIGFERKGDEKLIPRTYNLGSQLDFAPQLFSDGNCLSGVPQYAIYLMHRFYHPEMTVTDLTRLAAYLISETATQDPKVGGPVVMSTITPAEGYQELSREMIDDIIRLNDEQNDRLRKFFFGGGQRGRQEGPADL